MKVTINLSLYTCLEFTDELEGAFIAKIRQLLTGCVMEAGREYRLITDEFKNNDTRRPEYERLRGTEATACLTLADAISTVVGRNQIKVEK